MGISRDEFKRLSIKQKRQVVSDYLNKGYSVRKLNKELGASHNLVVSVSKELRTRQELQEERENKILEVNKSLKNITTIEEVSSKAEEIKQTLSRLNNTEEVINSKLNSVIQLKLEVSEAILKNVKERIKEGSLTLDYDKIISEVIKNS